MTTSFRAAIVDATAFLIGLLTAFTVNLVGNMPLAEFVTLAAAGVMVVTISATGRVPESLLRNPIFLGFLVFQALAFGGYIMSDLYRDSDMRDAIRGWSRMIFLAIDIAVIAALFAVAPRSFLWLQCGSALGGVLYGFLHRAEIGDVWKFGYAAPVTLVVFLLAPSMGFRVGALIIGALGVLHLALDFRGMGGVCLVLAMLVGLQKVPHRYRMMILPAAVVVGCAATAWFYQSQQARGDSQRGGRSDVERKAMIDAAWQGFQESPLIGQGSWFSKSRVMDYFLARRYEAAKLAGVHGYSDSELEDNLAIHSQILVAFAEGGVMGGIFFAFYGVTLLGALTYCAGWRTPDRLSGIYLFVLALSIWNLLLSPFSGSHRIGIATSCGLILILWQERRERARGDEMLEAVAA